MGVAIVIAAFAAAAGADEPCQLEPVAQAELLQRLTSDAAGALEQAEKELRSHPKCWVAIKVKSDALVALGRRDEAVTWLTAWANLDRSDPRRIEALIELYRTMGDWSSTPDLMARIDPLSEPSRTTYYGILLEALQRAKETKLADDVFARMSAPPSSPAASPRVETCRLNGAAFLTLERWIAEDKAEEALSRARGELETHPDCWAAHRVQAGALVALGEPGAAGELLIGWANRDRADPSRIEALIDHARKTGTWDTSSDLIGRIDALPEPARTRLLRDLLDELYDAHEPRRAEPVLGRLLAGASEEQAEVVRRALEAATRGNVRAMWAELPALPSADFPALRTETLILLARRVASACATRSCPFPEDLTVTPEVLPRLVTKKEPSYPDGARRERSEGSMVFFLAVLPSGEPLVLGSARETDPRFLRAGAEAVAQWRYEPARIADEAVTVSYTVRVDFRVR